MEKNLFIYYVICLHPLRSHFTFEWLLSSDRFPIAAAVVAIALPFMRKNHLNTIRKEESSSL